MEDAVKRYAGLDVSLKGDVDLRVDERRRMVKEGRFGFSLWQRRWAGSRKTEFARETLSCLEPYLRR